MLDYEILNAQSSVIGSYQISTISLQKQMTFFLICRALSYCTNSLWTTTLVSKKTLSTVSIYKLLISTFLERENTAMCYSELWCFVSGLYLKFPRWYRHYAKNHFAFHTFQKFTHECNTVDLVVVNQRFGNQLHTHFSNVQIVINDVVHNGSRNTESFSFQQ